MAQEDAQPVEPPTLVLHYCPFRAPVLALVLVLIVAAFTSLAWEAFDPHWSPNPKGKGAWVILALATLPVWVRAPMLVGILGEGSRIMIYRLLHTFDDQPDLTINPDGIGGVDYLTFRIIPWAEVDRIELRRRHLFIIGKKRETGLLTGLLFGRRHTITYPLILFREPVGDLIAAIRHYRPDLAA